MKARVSRGNQKLGTGTGTGLGLPIFAVGYISSSGSCVFSLELVAQLYLLRAEEPMWSVDGTFSHVSRKLVDHHHDHRRLNMMAWANDDDVDEKRNWEARCFFVFSIPRNIVLFQKFQSPLEFDLIERAWPQGTASLLYCISRHGLV